MILLIWKKNLKSCINSKSFWQSHTSTTRCPASPSTSSTVTSSSSTSSAVTSGSSAPSAAVTSSCCFLPLASTSSFSARALSLRSSFFPSSSTSLESKSTNFPPSYCHWMKVMRQKWQLYLVISFTRWRHSGKWLGQIQLHTLLTKIYFLFQIQVRLAGGSSLRDTVSLSS